MINQIIIFIGLVVIILVAFVCLLKQFNSIHEKQRKLESKLLNLDSKQDKFDSFLIPTYNNSIRIAKKLGVYYAYNKSDYENHKNEKIAKQQ